MTEQSEDIQQLVSDLTLRNTRLEEKINQITIQFEANQKMTHNVWDETDKLYQDTILEMREKINQLENRIDGNLIEKGFIN